MGHIHFAKLDNSDRLQKLLMCLASGNACTTLELMLATKNCAVATSIDELRHNGIPVECKCIGKSIYTYQLTEFAR
jgi:hypothetical protein